MDVDTSLLRRGNRRALARAITLIESTLGSHRDQAQHVLEELLPFTGDSIRIGISGVPGVGKSTFIESFGLYLIAQGMRVAVLAVDASSPVHGGSVLGDKVRMEELSRAEETFIRPSPSGGVLGGVAERTRETVLLCEAAGYDIILVETVGVGQSEVDVAGMVDFFLVLMLPNSGDEVQGIKRGIMEMVDGVVINKADGESINLAKIAQSHYQNALHLSRRSAVWTPRVLTCSALEKTGLEDIWGMIEDYRSRAEATGCFQEKRARQSIDWMNKLVSEGLQARLRETPAIRSALPEEEKKVYSGETTPHLAARRILELFQ